jgi:hypothetical protein
MKTKDDIAREASTRSIRLSMRDQGELRRIADLPQAKRRAALLAFLTATRSVERRKSRVGAMRRMDEQHIRSIRMAQAAMTGRAFRPVPGLWVGILSPLDSRYE